MTTTTRPTADEYSTFLAGYVARIADGEDILKVLAEQLDEVLVRLGPIDEARGGFRYVAGKWSIKEIVGHLSDAERIFSYRALCIARGDATPLPGFDENAYAPEVRADERTLADLTAEWADVRRATLALFGHLPERAWERRGIASDNPVSVRALAYAVAGHVRHHLQVLEERYLGS